MSHCDTMHVEPEPADDTGPFRNDRRDWLSGLGILVAIRDMGAPMNRRRSSLSAVLIVAVACSHDSSSTGPKPVAGVKCELASGTGTVTLGALQGTTVNC